MRQSVVLLGASGLAREVAAVVEAAANHNVVGVLDDNISLQDTACAGTTVIGNLDSAEHLDDVQFVICAGSGDARRQIAQRLVARGIGSERYATVVHRGVAVPSSCLIGAGSVLLANVTLTADVTLGEHVVVMPQVVLTHDDVIADFATLCAGVVLGGSVHVGSAAYVGMNASVRQQLVIGARSTVGMGAVVIDDVADQATVVGNPARVLRWNDKPRVTLDADAELIFEQLRTDS